jgi:hypothetical protein
MKAEFADSAFLSYEAKGGVFKSVLFSTLH